MKWRTLSGEKVNDINKWIIENCHSDQVVHVGTDSLNVRKQTHFVTVVIVHTPTKGGRVAYTRESVPRIHSLRLRLMDEVWRSVGIAMSLSALTNEINVHVDANPDERFASSKYVKELASMVMSQGFTCILKPASWAATHASDHIVRSFGKNADIQRKNKTTSRKSSRRI